jgi:hypothetical protein
LGHPIAQIAREHNLNLTTLYRWKETDPNPDGSIGWPPQKNPISLNQAVPFYQIGVARLMMLMFQKAMAKDIEDYEGLYRLSLALVNYGRFLETVKKFTTFDFSEQLLAAISQVRQNLLNAEDLTEEERAKLHAVVQRTFAAFSNDIQSLLESNP